MTGTVAYAMAKTYVEESLVGVGAIKGANCTIKSIVDDPTEGTHTVTFEWTATDGTKRTSVMIVKDGQGEGDVEPLEPEQLSALVRLIS